ELLEGGTLRERLGGRPLGVRQAIDYAVQLARGLAAAHEHDIVHRDLKPENLFITNEGRLKILDFGIAKLPRPETDSRTLTGAALPDGARARPRRAGAGRIDRLPPGSTARRAAATGSLRGAARSRRRPGRGGVRLGLAAPTPGADLRAADFRSRPHPRCPVRS